MNLKRFFALSLMMLPCLGQAQAQAQANVCLSKSGEKVFSEATCESRDMRTAPADFQVLSAQPVFVVPPSNAAVATVDSARNTPAKVTGEKPSIYGNFKGLAWFIVALMPIAACLFLSFHVVMYIKKRLRKLRHVRSKMGEGDA
jgi:hypothetical protein